MLGRGGLRVAGAALVLATLLFAAPLQSWAASYSLAYAGTVTSVHGPGGGGVFHTLGVVGGDPVSGTLTINALNESPSASFPNSNTFNQAEIGFTFQLTHPANLGFSDSGPGIVVSMGDPAFSGFNFSSNGEDSTLSLNYQAGGPGVPLTSLAGLPTTSSGLMALLAMTSRNAFGSFDLGGLGVIEFSIDFATAVTPIPAALPLFASALGGLGFMTWRRRKMAAGASAELR
jgi:hypothetical protein